jgi:hypothetical protein
MYIENYDFTFKDGEARMTVQELVSELSQLPMGSIVHISSLRGCEDPWEMSKEVTHWDIISENNRVFIGER